MENLTVVNKEKCVLLVTVAGVSASGMSRTLKAHLYTAERSYNSYAICDLIGKKPTKNGLIRIQGCGFNSFQHLADLIAKNMQIKPTDIIIETF